MLRIGLHIATVSYCLITILITLSFSWKVLISVCCITAVTTWVGCKYAKVSCVVGLMLCVLASVIAYARMEFVPENPPIVFQDLFDTKQTLTGTVVTLPDRRETSDRLTVELTSGIEHMRIIAAVPPYPATHVGDKVSVTGTLRKPKPFDTDGGRTFAYDDFLRKDGVFGVMQPAKVQVIGQDISIWFRYLRTLETIRNICISQISTAIPDPQSALAVGILVGGKQGLGESLLEAFTTAGMLQIIVLSGYNVMIVANTLMSMLGWLPRHLRFIAGSCSIACFVLLAGAGPSALRAGLMSQFAIAARTFGYTHDVLLAVSGSVLLLALWNPLMLVHDPGFQFSFIATIGLIVGTPLITPLLSFLRSGVAIELFATTLAAEIVLLPLLLWQTGHLSIVSVIANVSASPAIPFAMASSAVVMLCSFPLQYIHPVLPLITGVPAYVSLTYIITVATLCASLPFASLIIPAFPFWVVLMSYSVYAGIYLYWSIRLRPSSDVLQLPSLDSQGKTQHTSSCQQVCNQP
jgi:competence protein ComEC